MAHMNFGGMICPSCRVKPVHPNGHGFCAECFLNSLSMRQQERIPSQLYQGQLMAQVLPLSAPAQSYCQPVEPGTHIVSSQVANMPAATSGGFNIGGPQYGPDMRIPQYNSNFGDPQHGPNVGSHSLISNVGSPQYGLNVGNPQYGPSAGASRFGSNIDPEYAEFLRWRNEQARCAQPSAHMATLGHAQPTQGAANPMSSNVCEPEQGLPTESAESITASRVTSSYEQKSLLMSTNNESGPKLHSDFQAARHKVNVPAESEGPELKKDIPIRNSGKISKEEAQKLSAPPLPKVAVQPSGRNPSSAIPLTRLPEKLVDLADQPECNDRNPSNWPENRWPVDRFKDGALRQKRFNGFICPTCKRNNLPHEHPEDLCWVFVQVFSAVSNRLPGDSTEPCRICSSKGDHGQGEYHTVEFHNKGTWYDHPANPSIDSWILVNRPDLIDLQLGRYFLPWPPRKDKMPVDPYVSWPSKYTQPDNYPKVTPEKKISADKTSLIFVDIDMSEMKKQLDCMRAGRRYQPKRTYTTLPKGEWVKDMKDVSWLGQSHWTKVPNPAMRRDSDNNITTLPSDKFIHYVRKWFRDRDLDEYNALAAKHDAFAKWIKKNSHSPKLRQATEEFHAINREAWAICCAYIPYIISDKPWKVPHWFEKQRQKQWAERKMPRSLDVVLRSPEQAQAQTQTQSELQPRASTQVAVKKVTKLSPPRKGLDWAEEDTNEEKSQVPPTLDPASFDDMNLVFDDRSAHYSFNVCKKADPKFSQDELEAEDRLHPQLKPNTDTQREWQAVGWRVDTIRSIVPEHKTICCQVVVDGYRSISSRMLTDKSKFYNVRRLAADKIEGAGAEFQKLVADLFDAIRAGTAKEHIQARKDFEELEKLINDAYSRYYRGVEQVIKQLHDDEDCQTYFKNGSQLGLRLWQEIKGKHLPCATQHPCVLQRLSVPIEASDRIADVESMEPK